MIMNKSSWLWQGYDVSPALWAVLVTVTLITIFMILRMVRNGSLRAKYATLWVIVGVGMLAVAFVPRILTVIRSLLGISVASNLLFFVAIQLLVLVSLHLSREASQLEEETRILGEEVALLRHRVFRLEQLIDPESRLLSDTSLSQSNPKPEGTIESSKPAKSLDAAAAKPDSE